MRAKKITIGVLLVLGLMLICTEHETAVTGIVTYLVSGVLIYTANRLFKKWMDGDDKIRNFIDND